ncbi:MAG: SRPBCC family protein [Cyclobacteriaceae bacterium]
MKNTNQYHFVTHWRLKATPEEVYDILDEPEALVRWWPSVYQAVLVKGYDSQGSANQFALDTKGWLPYSLHWEFHTVEKSPPRRLALEARGDFVGTGIWRFIADQDMVDVTYDWKISAEKPLLRFFSFLLKPIFSANHRWAMEKGRESIALELARRRALSAEERSKVALPPGPVKEAPFWLAGSLAGIAGLLLGGWLWKSIGKR